MARCPYCHNNSAREDKYHAGTCENCGGILEAEGGYLNFSPLSTRSYITQEQLDDCCIDNYYKINITASGEVTDEFIKLLGLELSNASKMD